MRTTWKGSINWGMVSIPVKLYKATTDNKISFRQINSGTGNRISQRRVDSVTGDEVEYSAIVKGFEMAKGEYVIVEDEEINALRPETNKTMTIEQVVSRSEIPAVISDQSYWVAPEEVGRKAYVLFVDSLGDDVAIARFTMRMVEYLTALSVDQNGILVATRLHYDDEVTDPTTIPTIDDDLDRIRENVLPNEAEMAEQLIDSMRGMFDHAEHVDEFRSALVELIDQKATTGVAELPAPIAQENSVTSLMAALEASVAASKAQRKTVILSDENAVESEVA